VPELRRATLEDLPALVELEHLCFDEPRRSSPASLRRSLQSALQTVWVAEDEFGLRVALILWHHPNSLRIYGVAVRPDLQGHGLGQEALRHAESMAQGRIMLEADDQDSRLLTWYERQGFQKQKFLADFYGPGRSAWRLQK
jgi:ribosomal protein S18 acetylase RimI-like enzyme